MTVVCPSLLGFPRVQSYGVMLLLACAVGWWLARRRARRFGMPAWQVDWLMPLLLIGCGLGTRLAGYLLQRIVGDAANDRVLFGGLFLAVAIGAVYAKMIGTSIWRLSDAFAYSLPLSIGILRVGCFMAGCCWGDLCVPATRLAAVEDECWQRQVQTIPALCREDWPLSVRYPSGSPAHLQHRAVGLLPPDNANRSLPVHPVQLYEAAASWILLGGLVLITRRLRRWGDSFLLSLLGYAVIRFVADLFRADSPLVAGGLTVSQYVSMGCASACLLILLMRHVSTAPDTGGAYEAANSIRALSSRLVRSSTTLWNT